jgi:hypothetical protein
MEVSGSRYQRKLVTQDGYPLGSFNLYMIRNYKNVSIVCLIIELPLEFALFCDILT